MQEKHNQQPDLEDNDDEVLHYIKNTGINLIPNNEDKDNIITANDDANNVEDAEAEEEDDDTTSVAHPMPNKVLHAMRQLSTFYNPSKCNDVHPRQYQQ